MKAQLIVAFVFLSGCGSTATIGVGPTFATDGTVRFEVQLAAGPTTYGLDKAGLGAQLVGGWGALGTRAGQQVVLGAGVHGALVADSGPSGHLSVSYLQREADVPSGRVTLYGGAISAGIAGLLGSGPAPMNGGRACINLCKGVSGGSKIYYLLGGALQPRFFAGGGHARGEVFVPLELNLWEL
ncbi:MAG: hypothetical protein JST54_24165 [Deltaproteobacteria bacterium]|nr:hypothetical protein [Deltaproteobacteria bacterium]